MRWMLAGAVALTTTVLPGWAMAQEGTDEAKTEAGEEEGEKAEQADKEKAGDKAKAEDATADAAGDDSPVEVGGTTYRFVGLRYRGIIVPKFMMNLFGDGGRTVYVHGFGPEFAIRKDDFEYVLSIWWAGYKMKETPFKSSSDPATGWEVVKSNINVIYLTADFLWSSKLSPQFAFNYGMGAGFGLVFGSLERTQAYPPSGDRNQDPYEWEKCSAEGIPSPEFCGTDNDHYDGYEEPSWAGGGSKPIIFPWLVAQTGFRYKPSKKFVGRLDLGFGLSGFFFGIGADYGL